MGSAILTRMRHMIPALAIIVCAARQLCITPAMHRFRYLSLRPAVFEDASEFPLVVTQHGSLDLALPPAHHPPSPARPPSRSGHTGPWRAQLFVASLPRACPEHS